MILTDESFNTLVTTNKVLVDFWAPWCGPCIKMNPILEEIEKETGLLIGKLNIDENPVKTQEYSVQTIPTMVLFDNGQPVCRISGAMPKHKLMEKLAQWL